MNLPADNAEIAQHLGERVKAFHDLFHRDAVVDQAGNFANANALELLHAGHAIVHCAEQTRVFEVTQEGEIEDRIHLFVVERTQVQVERVVHACWLFERRERPRVLLDEASCTPQIVLHGFAGHGARLFSRIAYVLHGLDALPALRERIDTQAWTARDTTEAFVRLIAGLLAVVFEAADSASDPAISRQLVALFNFMQGKEFAGQERAAGSALFASGRADSAGQQRLLHLIDSQERCLQVFKEFASDELATLWATADQDTVAARAELERMRRVLCTAADGSPLDANQSQPWFDCCSLRMDRMKTVEDRLADSLQRLCEHKTQAALTELLAFEGIHPVAVQPDDALSFFHDPVPDHVSGTSPAQAYGVQLDRSILDLVQDQARRLQAVSDELDTVRASLNERKLVERAKGLLMAHRNLSEAEAHKTLRQMAMNQNRRLVDVAEAVLAMADVLPDRSGG